MPTSSFDSDFAITKIETVKKLEKAIENIIPMNIDTTDVISDMQKREKELIEILKNIKKD